MTEMTPSWWWGKIRAPGPLLDTTRLRRVRVVVVVVAVAAVVVIVVIVVRARPRPTWSNRNRPDTGPATNPKM